MSRDQNTEAAIKWESALRESIDSAGQPGDAFTISNRISHREAYFNPDDKIGIAEIATADAKDYKAYDETDRFMSDEVIASRIEASNEYREAFQRETSQEAIQTIQEGYENYNQDMDAAYGNNTEIYDIENDKYFAKAKQAQINRIAADTARVQEDLTATRSARMEAQNEFNTVEQGQSIQLTEKNNVISDEVFMAADSSLPDSVIRPYLKVGTERYHFRSSPDDLAFIDKGNKLETPSNSHMVAETLIRIAEQRGWDEIRLTGTESFRRDAWYEAARRGISVRGYTPTEVDKAKLAELVDKRQKTEKEISRNEQRVNSYLTKSPEKALENTPELAGAFAAREAIRDHLSSTNLSDQEKATVLKRVDDRISDDLRNGNIPSIKKEERAQGISGKVLEHGPAKFNFQENESSSYFVRIETDRGTRTIWGKDLERAISDGEIKTGQNATFKITGKEQVAVNANVYDKQTGAIIETRPQQATRNTWSASRADTENVRVLENDQLASKTEKEAER